jgi:hypothetical protein
MSTSHDMLFELGGAPVSGRRFSNPFCTHWFVDGVSGNDDFDGKTPASAKKKINTAIQLMGVGDVLYIRPQTYVVGTGHARYTECATIDLTQSDLTIIGAGYPRSNEFGVRMKATSTEVQCFLIDGPSSHFENIGFFGDGTATYTIYGRNNGATNTQRGSDGICFYQCNFKGAPAYINGGQAGRFIDCVFNNAAGELWIASNSVTGYNQQIRGCAFLDTAQQTAPTHPQLGEYAAANVVCLWVDRCFFGKIPTTVPYYINFNGANCTGLVTASYFDSVNVDTDTDVKFGSTFSFLVGCYDQTGLIDATND